VAYVSPNWERIHSSSLRSLAQAANEDPDTSSLHVVVEHVDIAVDRFVLEGRVAVVAGGE
jgi:hypothetical protein